MPTRTDADVPARIVCVTLSDPSGARTGGELRTRRLLEALVPLGDVEVLVLGAVRDADASAAELSVQRVVSLDLLPMRQTRTLAAVARRPWLPGRFARLSSGAGEVGRSLDQRSPDLVWAARAEAWITVPTRWRHRCVVELSDLPGRNAAVELGAARSLARRALATAPRRASADLRTLATTADTRARISVVERSLRTGPTQAVLCSALEVAQWPGAWWVPNGFDDPGLLDGAGTPGPGPATIVLPASYHYPPNLDALAWFVDEIWPGLRGAVPDARAVAAGGGDDRLDRLIGHTAIASTGPVAGLSSVFDIDSVVAVPLRHGSGTRLKILEAWARGVPVVSTTIGAEGLGAVHERELLVADTTADFVEACRRVVTEPELRARLVRAGRARYEAHHRWDHIGTELRDRVTDHLAVLAGASA